MKYYKIKGKCGVYLLTKGEIDKAIDRENRGVVGIIIDEKDYEKELAQYIKNKR